MADVLVVSFVICVCVFLLVFLIVSTRTHAIVDRMNSHCRGERCWKCGYDLTGIEKQHDLKMLMCIPDGLPPTPPTLIYCPECGQCESCLGSYSAI